MAYTMYAGALQGRVETCHMAHRAGDVRRSIAQMFYVNEIASRYDEGMKAAWTKARAEGWRVVPVVVATLPEWRSR